MIDKILDELESKMLTFEWLSLPMHEKAADVRLYRYCMEELKRGAA